MQTYCFMKPYYAIVLALAVITFYSCNEESVSSIEHEHLDNVMLEFNHIGENHNTSLAYIANDVPDLEHAENNALFGSTIKYYRGIGDAKTANELEDFKRPPTLAPNTDALVANPDNNFSDAEVSYLKAIEEIVSSDVIDKEALFLSLADDISDDPQTLNKPLLYGSVSIAINSYKYWVDVYENKDTHPFGFKFDQVDAHQKLFPFPYFSPTVVADIVSYADCMGNIQTGTYETAVSVCTGQSAYSSAIASQ